MKLRIEDAEWLRKVFLAATNGATTERNRRIANWLDAICVPPKTLTKEGARRFVDDVLGYQKWLDEKEAAKRKRLLSQSGRKKK